METQAVKTDIPHHDGSSLYVSDQAPAVGSQIRLRMRIPATYGSVDRVFVRSIRDGEPHFDEAHRVELDLATAVQRLHGGLSLSDIIARR